MNVLAIAPVVRRHTPTWPSRKASYYDFSRWGGGFVRCHGAPGAIHLRDNLMGDLRTGAVYTDERFV